MLNRVGYFNFSALNQQKSKISNETKVDSRLKQKTDSQSDSVKFSSMAKSGKVSFGRGLKFEIVSGKDAAELNAKYGKVMKECIEQVNQRAGKPEQFLNWIGKLPKIQLGRIDELADIAKTLKTEGGRGNLGCIGIGGSKHPVQFDLTFNNKMKKTKFLSEVEPFAVKSYLKELGRNARHLVIMRSGETTETNYGFKKVLEATEIMLKKDYLKQGKSVSIAEEMAKKEAKNRFVLITLEGTNKKNNFRKWAEENGFATASIHEDCGGRYGYGDDHVAIADLYNGMTKAQLKKKYEGLLEADKRFLNTKDLLKNPAALKAMADVDAFRSGKKDLYHYFYGKRLEGAKDWDYQLHKESWGSELNDIHTCTGPDFFHHSTEADLDPRNVESTYTLYTMKNSGGEEYSYYNSILDNFKNSYPQKHPVNIVELAGTTPKDSSELAEFEHISTVLSQLLNSRLNKNPFPPMTERLRSVTQLNVEAYKEAIRQANAKTK